MRRVARTDANHAAIREALRLAGHTVHDCSRYGGGFPDLLVRTRRRTLKLLEVKHPREGATPIQAEFMARFPETVVVRTIDEALKACQ